MTDLLFQQLERKVAELKAKKNDLSKKNKELMGCRENLMRLEDELEAAATHASILYCVIGALSVALIFVICKTACSAEDEKDSDLPGSPSSSRRQARNLVSSKNADNMA